MLGLPRDGEMTQMTQRFTEINPGAARDPAHPAESPMGARHPNHLLINLIRCFLGGDTISSGSGRGWFFVQTRVDGAKGA